MHLRWQKSLDNFKLFWVTHFQKAYKVIISNNYYYGYSFLKIDLSFSKSFIKFFFINVNGSSLIL
jgi:hypothetical protein